MITFRSFHDANTSRVEILHNSKIIGHVGWGLPHNLSTGYPIGYRIEKEFEGQGLITRALQLLIDETQLTCLQACVRDYNFGSIRVLEKCGFKMVGRSNSKYDNSILFYERKIKRKAQVA